MELNGEKALFITRYTHVYHAILKKEAIVIFIKA
jgi:hypothetical protein